MVQIGIDGLKLIEVILLPDVLNIPRFHGKYKVIIYAYPHKMMENNMLRYKGVRRSSSHQTLSNHISEFNIHSFHPM